MEMDAETKKRLASEFAEKVKAFPSETERKQIIFDSFNKILQAVGSYLNDSQFSLTHLEIDGEEFVKLQTVYATHTQNVTHDSAAAFFNDILKLAMKNCRELKDTKHTVDEYFNEG